MKNIIYLLFLSVCSLPAIAQTHTDDSAMRVVLMADINESYGSTHYGEYVDTALTYVEKWNPDFILFAGDMIAGQSLDLTVVEIRAMWDGFEETIGQPLRDLEIPFAFTLGNHDGSGSGNFNPERELAAEYWNTHMPKLAYVSRENYPFYYSFIHDDLFVISWDATNHLISEEEIRWVKEQLGTQEARNATKRIMLGHLPLYAVAEGRNLYGEVLKDADTLFKLMVEHHVNYYFSGHHHAWYPAKKDGLKMIHSGAQGSGPRPLIGSELAPRRTITLLDRKSEDSGFRITTFDLENNMEEILPEELPEVIEGINGKLYRYNYYTE